MSYEGLQAEVVSFKGHNGDTGEAYYARPTRAGKVPGIVVIMHLPGWDEWIIEVTRKFAHHGYAAIAPHLYFRDGPGSPDDIGARVRAAGGVADAQVVGDVAGAVAYLRAQPNASGKVGIIGFCSGGRHAYLTACSAPGFDALVDCWGGNVVVDDPRSSSTPSKPVAPIDLTEKLTCADDRHLRQRRHQPEPRARQQDRGGAQEARQELRVPPLRRLRPRLLQLGAVRRTGPSRRPTAGTRCSRS